MRLVKEVKKRGEVKKSGIHPLMDIHWGMYTAQIAAIIKDKKTGKIIVVRREK